MAISLQVPVQDQSQTLPELQQRVLQIIEQKGHFRHVTENSLLAEEDSTKKEQYDDGDVAHFDGHAEGGDEDDGESRDDRLTKLWRGREEMLQQLGRAQNEVLTALDFVSLLLSSQSAAAQGSMSPALKQAVPIGSLDARVIQSQTIPVASKSRLEQTSQGWRSQGFEAVFDKLSAASSRLKEESSRESKYWDQTARLRQQGWAVSRHPRDSKAIGVHFGFSESAPQFRTRDFALLRQDDLSNVYLDQANLASRKRALNVLVYRRGNLTGSYAPNYSHTTTDIGAQLIRERDGLFEEELFYEMSREARIIANYGVVTRANTIKFDLNHEVQVSFVSGDVAKDHQTPSKSKDDVLAQIIGLSLRQKLIKAHEERLRRRSQPPPPMTAKVKSEPECHILRPVLARLKHQWAIDTLDSRVSDLVKILSKAGLSITYNFENPIQGSLNARSDGEAPDSLDQLSTSTLRLDLPTERRLETKLSTFLGPPLYGTRFAMDAINYDFTMMKHSQYDNLEDAYKNILHTIKLDLMALVLNTFSPRKDASAKGTRDGWEAPHPRSGQLILLRSGKAVARVKLDVESDTLSCKVILFPDSEEQVIVGWVWDADDMSTVGDIKSLGGEVESIKSFTDVVSWLSKNLK